MQDPGSVAADDGVGAKALLLMVWSLKTTGAFAGGQAYSIVSILDAMSVIKPEISTVAFGVSASTATLLLVGTRCRCFCGRLNAAPAVQEAIRRGLM